MCHQRIRQWCRVVETNHHETSRVQYGASLCKLLKRADAIEPFFNADCSQLHICWYEPPYKRLDFYRFSSYILYWSKVVFDQFDRILSIAISYV